MCAHPTLSLAGYLLVKQEKIPMTLVKLNNRNGRKFRGINIKAQKTFQLETDRLASKLGVSGVKVSLFDAHGRWGSCSPSKKSIRYSWRVIMAPTDVLVYLAAHEVAHLRHPDHSPAFWATVNELLGKPYKPGRAWLKARGHELFKYAAAKDLKG